MSRMQTIWMLWLVLAACCAMAAERPVVWYPAQQAQDTQSPAPPEATTQDTATQEPQSAPPPASGSTPAGTTEDPRLLQPLQPLEPLSSSTPLGAPVQPQDTTAPALQPDTTPLNTPEPLTLGSPAGGGRNYFTPSLRFTQYGMTSTSPTGWNTMAVTNLSGTADLAHNWSRTNLQLSFTSGGTLYPTDSNLNSSFQQLSLQLGFHVNRWSFRMSDQASYLPESGFGYFGLGMGQLNGGLGSQFTPNQSILSNATRVSNTTSATLDYRLSARGSLHFYATYGLLRFQGGTAGTLVNSDNINYSAGYDRTFGRNTLGVSYVGSMFNYGGSSYSVRTDGANIAFGRRITGRLAWQVAGGPQVRTIDIPLLGTDNSPTWNLNTGLTYQVGRLGLNTSFSRNTSAGSGVLAGATTYQWLVGARRPLGRQWTGGINFGVARNTSLQQLAEHHFQTEFASAQISRLITRQASVYLSYNFQHQTNDIVVCPGCGDTFDRHVFGAGFQWQGRPMGISPF